MRALASWIQSSSATAIALLFLASCGISVTVEYSDSDAGSGAVAGKGGTSTGGTDGGHAGGSGGGGSGGVVSCNNSVCQPTPPPGWNGFAYVVGAPNADPTPVGPTCPDGSDPTTYFTQPAGAAECTSCACGGLEGVQCDVPFLCSTSTNCANPTDYTLGDGDCQGAASTPPKSCMLGTPTFSGGSCVPSGGVLAGGAPFQQVAHVCVADSPGTCTGGAGTCVAPGTDEYAGYVCIYQVGEQTCPAPYSIPIITYKKPKDTRACSACTCAPNVTGCTLGSYQFFSDAVCLLGGANVSTQTCSSFNVVPTIGWGWQRTNAPVGIGTCAALGGVGSGEAKGDPAQAITYCCKSP
jgi:hypothetical protein